MPVGELFGAERVVRPTVHELGQAGVRQDADPALRVAPEVGDVRGHLLRAGGAVQPDDVDRIGLEHGQGGRDVRAEQHGAGGLHGDLRHHRDAPGGVVGLGVDVEDRGQRALGLQEVLAGLDQQDVHSAVHQPAHLLHVAGVHLVPVDVQQAR